MIINLPKKRIRDNRVTNISKSFTHKMAAKTSWHRYGTTLRHSHPMYSERKSADTNGTVLVPSAGHFNLKYT